MVARKARWLCRKIKYLSPSLWTLQWTWSFKSPMQIIQDWIVSKNCDDLISLAHHNELSLLLGYEEMKRITKGIPEFALDRVLHFDLEEIYMYCEVNCVENPYIAN